MNEYIYSVADLSIYLFMHIDTYKLTSIRLLVLNLILWLKLRLCRCILSRILQEAICFITIAGCRVFNLLLYPAVCKKQTRQSTY
jgi:hypothetical protein